MSPRGEGRGRPKTGSVCFRLPGRSRRRPGDLRCGGPAAGTIVRVLRESRSSRGRASLLWDLGTNRGDPDDTIESAVLGAVRRRRRLRLHRARSGRPRRRRRTPAPMTAEQSVDWYQKCWGLFNDKNWDAFQNCYAPDAKESVDTGQPPAQGRAAPSRPSKPRWRPTPTSAATCSWSIHSGNRLVGVALWKGTNTGAMPGPDGKEIPATGKKFGFLLAHSAELDAGRSGVRADVDWIETGTLLGQLGLTEGHGSPGPGDGRGRARDRDREERRERVLEHRRRAAAVPEHQHARHGRLRGPARRLATCCTRSACRPTPTRSRRSPPRRSCSRRFSNAKITPSEVFAAGAYVVAIGTLEGTNDGAWPAMGITKKTDKPVKLASSRSSASWTARWSRTGSSTTAPPWRGSSDCRRTLTPRRRA